MKEKYKPAVGIIIGNPAGIGPGIIPKALEKKHIYDGYRSLVTGCVNALERAEAVLPQCSLEFNRIEPVSDACFRLGSIDVLETGHHDISKLVWGKEQVAAGQITMDSIRTSTELGLEGETDAVTTAPINKVAIKMVGVKQAGHTEVYMDDTKAPYVLTMFDCFKMRVFHLSRYISLVNAIRYAIKEYVLNDVCHIDKESKHLGMETPYIAVAGISPHSGEGELLGDEEMKEIIPAIEEARKRGINAIGPVPPDTLFSRGKNGEFDTILAMYYDQGHMPCETLDLERTVSVILGLPFLRCSVDHGTAFDIAGKGIATNVSMATAIDSAVEYAKALHDAKQDENMENHDAKQLKQGEYMMIGVVTDDFTDTTSAGALIARSQARTGLFLDTEALEGSEGARYLDAVSISSNNRHLKPESAYKEVCKATKALKSTGVTCSSKEIDTTLRGRIGNEIGAMLDTLGGDMVAVMVPTMPQSRRVYLSGISTIDGAVLTETPIAQDVKTPVKDAFISRLIQGQSRRKVELISIENVNRGKGTLKCAMIDARERGGQILVIDAVTLEHIDLIVQTCVELGWNVLVVDPSALTIKLNYRRGIIKEEVSTGAEGSTGPEEKVALFVVGSANPLTKAQMKYLCSSETNIPVHVSAYMLINGQVQFEEEVDWAVGIAVNLFRQKPEPQSIIIGTALQDCVMDLDDEDPRCGHDSGTCSRLINEGLAEIMGRVMELAGREQVVGLLLTGGDTMESVCRRLHVSYIEAIDHIVPQVDVGRIVGNYTGLPVVMKGGFCGGREIGMAVVGRLLSESAGCREGSGRAQGIRFQVR